MAQYLVGDIGGTRARLALIDETGEITWRLERPTAEVTSVATACADVLSTRAGSIRGVAIAAAGPYKHGTVTLTNGALTLSCRELRQATGVTSVLLLNDLQAAAWGLDPDTLASARTVHGTPMNGSANCLLVSIGTGLGVAGILVPDRRIVAGEGGHMRLCPETAEDVALFARLRAAHPEFRAGISSIEAEAVLSGPGIQRLHAALGGTPHASVPEILENARRTRGPARDALERFKRLLGAFLADLALMFGTDTTIALTGGVLQAAPRLLDEAVISALQGAPYPGRLPRDFALCHIPDPDMTLRGACKALIAQNP